MDYTDELPRKKKVRGARRANCSRARQLASRNLHLLINCIVEETSCVLTYLVGVAAIGSGEKCFSISAGALCEQRSVQLNLAGFFAFLRNWYVCNDTLLLTF